jgi:hypothetical protein
MTRHQDSPGNGPGDDNAAAANADAGRGGEATDDRFDRAVPDIDGEPAIADTLYAATEELEHAAPELRARADSIAEVIGPLVHTTDPAMLLIDDPDPATALPDDQAEHLAELLTDAAAQANSLATVLMEAADQADGLAAVLTDEHTGNE